MTKHVGMLADLYWDPAGGTAWGSAISQVRDISGPSFSRNAIDVTTRDQTDDYWMEYLKGLKDGGELTFDLAFDPAVHGTASSGLLSDFEENTTIPEWRLVFPDSTEWTFPGFLTAFEPAEPLDDVLGASLTVKISGKPTLA